MTSFSPPSAPNFAAFQREAIADATLFSRLHTAPDADAFAALAVELGAERGFTFTADEVRQGLQQARREWIERNVPRFGAAPMHAANDACGSLEGWTPVHVSHAAEGPQVEWRRLGPERFSEPFFEQTLMRALRNPACLLLRQRRPVASLEDFASRYRVVPPRGFIFHLSRCGSTLLAQMLAAVPRNVVASEPPPLDQILSAQHRDPQVTREQRIAWFRGMVAALGQPRAGGEENLFIKLDSWHVRELPLIREAFPDVPWIFLYRDPLEVMVSQRRQRGTQMIPGIVDPRWFGFDPVAVAQMTLDDYCARVLAQICEAAAQHAALGGRLVNFTQLPQVLWDVLGGFFGVNWTPEEVGRMQQAAEFSAKTPSLPHVDDREAKQREAGEEIRGLVAKHLSQPYARLEELRAAQRG